jgi:hypothetical protein
MAADVTRSQIKQEQTILLKANLHVIMQNPVLFPIALQPILKFKFWADKTGRKILYFRNIFQYTFWPAKILKLPVCIPPNQDHQFCEDSAQSVNYSGGSYSPNAMAS